MGFLSTIAAVLGTCAAGFCTKIAADEFAACATLWAKRIVRRATRSLPDEERVASEVEWLAHVEGVPGNVSKLLHACSLWRTVLIRKIDLSNAKAYVVVLKRNKVLLAFIMAHIILFFNLSFISFDKNSSNEILHDAKIYTLISAIATTFLSLAPFIRRIRAQVNREE